MKINIGPYRETIGPYQIAEKILFWKDKESDAVFALGDWLHERTPTTRVCEWYSTKVLRRKIDIRIDKHDTYSMDHTLALIIVPMLIQLRDTNHGSPGVDDKDVPEELRATAVPALANEYDTDANWEKRWLWVIDEMIWAFEQIVDYNSDDKFFDYSTTPPSYNNANHVKHDARIQNGIMLFGKYFRNLWD